jgi:glycoside/pentoside/hexuronide:cation symporter, GPH family
VREVFGDVPSLTGEAAPQAEAAKLGVLLGVTLLPTILVGLSLLFLRGYDLAEQRLAEAGEASRR